MKIALPFFFLFAPTLSFAFECAPTAPFIPQGKLAAKISVARSYGSHGSPNFEDICKIPLLLDWYDVSGREEEAYYCLKPKASEVAQCDTELSGLAATISVVPSSWIRGWEGGQMREFRFHAYVQSKKDPTSYLDLFGRNLSGNLNELSSIIDGSVKTGPGNPSDGFWIRVEFSPI
jgi:hypothetical protein